MDKTHFNKTLLASSLTLALPMLASTAQGAAFYLQETSATGLGRAFAGDAAISDNASSIQRNPAASADFDKSEVSFGLIYIDPTVDLKGTNRPILGNESSLDQKGIVDSAVVPNLYYAAPINEDWSWGLGMFSNFGLKTEFPNDYPAGPLAGQTSLTTININPSVAWQVASSLSLGLGVSAIYGDAEIIRTAGDLATFTPQAFPNGSETEVANMNGQEWGYGWNAGLNWDIEQGQRFAISYRSKTDIKFKDDFTGLASAYQTVPAELELNLPDTFEFAGNHKLTERFNLHYSVTWFGWSTFEELLATSQQCASNTCFQKDEKFKDSYRYAFGGTWALNNQWSLRIGYALDESPVPADYRSISIPDADRTWYSIGTTWAASDNLGIDLGFSYLDTDTVTVEESLVEGLPGYQFESSGEVFLFGGQVNFKF